MATPGKLRLTQANQEAWSVSPRKWAGPGWWKIFLPTVGVRPYAPVHWEAGQRSHSGGGGWGVLWETLATPACCMG